jgi:large conductance mechanosensitive channel
VLKEFKDFLMKGNLVEIAVGLILALTFKAVIDSVVLIINQLIAALLGSTTNFDDLYITVRDGRVYYGVFLTATVSFVLTGFILFLIVKTYNKAVDMARREGKTEETEEDSAEVVLLREIRDALASRDGR